MINPQLPEHFQQALLNQPGPVCSMLIINDLGSVIVKTEEGDIANFRGPVPIFYRYELARYPEGAAIRLYLEIRDQPNYPYKLETFLNPDSQADLALLRCLQEQAVLDIHFFDMAVNYVYSKRVRHRQKQRQELAQLVEMALEFLAGIPHRNRDWSMVKGRFQRDVPL